MTARFDGWPERRQIEVPMILGKRVMLCAFSQVTPLLAEAGLEIEHPAGFGDICAEACLQAPPGRIDSAVGAVVRDLESIGSAAWQALETHPEGQTIRRWLLSSDGGWGGGDPRGFWRDAILWVGRRHPPFEEETRQRLIWEFSDDVHDRITDAAWQAKVDAALGAPQSLRDAEVTARQGYHLLTGAAVGGDINQVAMILGPMRDWAILTGAWARASARTRAALPAVGPAFWQEQRRIGLGGSRYIDDDWLVAPQNAPDGVFGDV